MTADDTVTAKLAEWEALAEGATERAEVAEQARAEAERRFQDRDAGAERSLHHWFIEGALWASAAAAPAIATALLGFVREALEGHEPMDWCPNPRHDAEGVCPECVVTCVKDGLDWPCPTEQAAQKWIGGQV